MYRESIGEVRAALLGKQGLELLLKTTGLNAEKVFTKTRKLYEGLVLIAL